MEHVPAVRFAEGTDDVIEGLAIPFGGPFTIRGRENVDIYGTRFGPETDLHLDWFPQRPVIYHHGQDGELGGSVIGTSRTADITDYDDGTRKGKWVKAQLDKRHEYYDTIRTLVSEGKLGWSHGTLDYMMKVDGRSGDVADWPLIELTLTPVEANPDAFVVSAQRSAEEAVLTILGEGAAERLAPSEPPAPAARGGASAWDASTGSSILSSIYSLMANERGEDEQVAMLQRAADAMTEFIAAEAAEPDPDLGANFMSANRAGARHSGADQARVDAAHQSAHTTLRATADLGANCDQCAADDSTDGPAPDDDGDEATGRSAEVRPVLITVTTDASTEPARAEVDVEGLATRAAEQAIARLLRR